MAMARSGWLGAIGDRAILLCAPVFLVLAAGAARAQPVPTFTEFAMAPGSRPAIVTGPTARCTRCPAAPRNDDVWLMRAVTPGPDGALWIANHSAIVRASLAGAVTVDVKPGSCRNQVNASSQIVLPVAIFGTVDVDVSMIDPATIRLEGVAALRGGVEDARAPSPPDDGPCGSRDPDGYADLLFKFSWPEVLAALSPPPLDGVARVLQLTGRLKAGNGGTPIQGQDVVIVTVDR
jgi:hypothetical protein